ncbi:hypothetical protein T440DRAFT_501644 [Plenodomus tracheiphilus IPT5]|uniref:Zn(2)-C6 fungal-type domain-containing protein n=1 Tax=Plenodomus tracheiphilus IPT5 TaxID=1408161 RepID=A0A6A7AU39_9PLEO|nr:hypothetical protein T440DRAFT_501644 [Plenodomus tracheiphilus IPT5]
MSSASEYNDAESSQDSSSEAHVRPPSRPSSRRQSHTPLTPRKRRRLESIDPSRIRNYYFEGKYNDAYRILYNEHVHRAAARFESLETVQHYTAQIGASIWLSTEQSIFFAALERLGKDDAPGIAKAVGTKSIPEVQELLLLLHDAATKHVDAKVMLRDIPAAIDIGEDCNEQLDTLAEALAWYQEMHEASEEQAKFGEYWLITSDIAAKIEGALNPDRSRAASSIPPSGAETPRRGGRVLVGACASCKLHKQKCDRGTPCGNCVRRKIDECIYPKTPAKSGPEPSTGPAIVDNPVIDVLQAIPEARLLNVDVMLTLSRTLFMNRSPSISSPWPHWSEIVSDLAEEPAIYRSAFRDFHTLVVSVTKRLVQTSITQATSRLRSQRQRTKNGVMPLVKRRDVLAALDVVGMKKNGQERWQGVARRCALRVIQGRPERVGGRTFRREVSWSEVERIMAPDTLLAEPFLTDTEVSEGPSPTFKRRAARSGTPLPMERLALSDSHSESDMEHSNADSDVSMLDGPPHSFARQSTQPRDLHGRYTSLAPTVGDAKVNMAHITIEEFDHKVSRQEERALRETLSIQAPSEDEPELGAGTLEEDGFEQAEKIVTEVNGWRSWMEYRHQWEEFMEPVPQEQFAANRKPLPLTLHTAMVSSDQINAVPDEKNYSSSDDGMARHRRKPLKSIELRTQDPRAYAAHQERAARLASPLESDESLSEDAVDHTFFERDHPTQSIEAADDTLETRDPDESMDWDTYVDI